MNPSQPVDLIKLCNKYLTISSGAESAPFREGDKLSY